MTKHKFSEKFSWAEEEARDEFIRDLSYRLEVLLDEIREDCQKIGGQFRGPGMRKDAREMVKSVLAQLE